MKKYLPFLLLPLVCLSCHAHRPHRHHHHPHRHHHVVVVTPAAKAGVCNQIAACDRMNMAIAYLSKNRQMSVKAYSKLTGLSKTTAEAELDAFASDRNIPIAISMAGKKKVYVLTHR